MRRAVVLVLATAVAVAAGNLDRVSLREVTALTLHAGRQTTGRRSSPVPQLQCISGCSEFTPSVVQCAQTGWDGQDAQVGAVSSSSPPPMNCYSRLLNHICVRLVYGRRGGGHDDDEMLPLG